MAHPTRDVPRITADGFAELVRQYMRDYPELNRLLASEEHGNGVIKVCMALAIDYFNTKGHPSSYTLADFPSLSLLMDLTCIELMKSVLYLKMRNLLAYSDGGFQVDPEANIRSYEQALDRLRRVAEVQLDNLKVACNILPNFGTSVSSEYGVLSGWLAPSTT